MSKSKGIEIKNKEEIKLLLGKDFKGWVFDLREEDTLHAYREDRPVETSYTMRDFIGDERDIKSVTRMIEWVNKKYPKEIYKEAYTIVMRWQVNDKYTPWYSNDRLYLTEESVEDALYQSKEQNKGIEFKKLVLKIDLTDIDQYTLN